MAKPFEIPLADVQKRLALDNPWWLAGGSVDLIYIDPPFDTGSDFSFRTMVGDDDDPVAGKEPSAIEEKAYRDTWGGGYSSYLAMMRDRLELLHGLLADSGSIFVHLDVHTGPYIKVLMDEIFGQDNFQNEIAWYYYNKMHDSRKHALPKAFDQILYYVKNKAQYGQPERREVRHILVKTKTKADELYGQLQSDADFSELAKKFSEDTGSKANGGKLTISRGQTVAPFDKTAFQLKKNEISKPVKTEFGFHIIQPIGDVQPAKTTPLKEVKDSIRQQLLQTKKNETMTKWVEDLKKDYEDKVSYAVGFTPPPTATGTTTAETK